MAACSAGQRPAGTAGQVPPYPTGPAVTRCSTTTGSAPVLRDGPATVSRVPLPPFGVAAAGSGFAFVTMGTGTTLTGGSVAVFADGAAGRPALVRRLAVNPLPEGEALTPDGRYLLVAAGSGIAVVSVRRAELGRPGAVLGALTSPGSGAIEVAVTPDGSLAFASLEGSSDIAVFDLRQALASHFVRSGYLGTIPAGLAPVGLALSPDGSWLYATSEQAAAGSEVGILQVISVRAARSRPADATVAVARAGCNPVRVITSADGRTVWVTARASDELLGFSAARLRSSPAGALAAAVRVGELPVGLALVDGGRRIVVADSDRFDVPGAGASLAVVNVRAALSGRAALAGYLHSGSFPRELALEPGGGPLLVTNYGSRQLQAVRVTGLP
jgi:DNA-binding beta-propeller fold protein YncE